MTTATYEGTGGKGETVHISMPRKEEIREVAQIRTLIDEQRYCGKGRTKCAVLRGTLHLDASDNRTRIYPLQITVSGTPKHRPTRTWRILFDEKEWIYRVPKDFPM
ncbi:MAG: hypothetical protein LBK01_07275 [Burkholderiaceae bacterium]|jgi:hypothetical protein|nr:hypothetical protein [Burkholderiaceae bacterium]